MIKKLFFAVVLMVSSFTTFAQATASIFLSVGDVNDLVLSADGYWMIDNGDTTYSQTTVILSVTGLIGDFGADPLFDSCFFVIKDNSTANVAKSSIGNGTMFPADPNADPVIAGNSTTDTNDGTTRTVTWNLPTMALINGDLTVGGIYDYRGSGANGIDATTIPVITAFIIPGTAVTEFNFDTDVEGFTMGENGASNPVHDGNGAISFTTAAVSTSGAVHTGTNFVDADTYLYAHIFYRNQTANTQLAVAVDGVTQNKAGGVSINMGATDPFEVALINLTGKAKWVGNVSGISIRPRINNSSGAAAGLFTIDRIIFTTGATLSTESAELASVKVYPNPTTGELNIKGLRDAKSFSIHNVLGQQVKTFSAQEKINISSLVKGVYFLQSDNGLNVKILKK